MGHIIIGSVMFGGLIALFIICLAGVLSVLDYLFNDRK